MRVVQSSIYAERSSLLWKGPDVLEWLRGVATRAADISEAGSIRRSGNTRVSAWVCTHTHTYAHRHVIVRHNVRPPFLCAQRRPMYACVCVYVCTG